MESGKLDFDLESVPVRVTNVNFDGLGRTKGDFVASAVGEVFKAKSFGEVILPECQCFWCNLHTVYVDNNTMQRFNHCLPL